MAWATCLGHDPKMRYPTQMAVRGSASDSLPVLWSLAIVLICVTAFSQSHSSASLPIGFFQIKVLPRSQILVSLAFEPYTSSIAGILGRQLVGGSVLKWNADIAAYQIAHHGPDGVWYSDETFSTPTEMTLSAGDGFWLRNNADNTQVVCLTGMVVGHDTPDFSYPPELSLAGTAFGSYRTFTNAAVGQIWRQTPVDGDALLTSTERRSGDEPTAPGSLDTLHQDAEPERVHDEPVLATR